MHQTNSVAYSLYKYENANIANVNKLGVEVNGTNLKMRFTAVCLGLFRLNLSADAPAWPTSGTVNPSSYGLRSVSTIKLQSATESIPAFISSTADDCLSRTTLVRPYAWMHTSHRLPDIENTDAQEIAYTYPLQGRTKGGLVGVRGYTISWLTHPLLPAMDTCNQLEFL